MHPNDFTSSCRGWNQSLNMFAALPTVAFPCDSIERTGWHLKHRKVHENEVISYSHTLCQPREGLSFLVKNCFVSKELDVYIQYLDKPGRCLHLRPIDQQKLSKAQGKIMFFLIKKSNKIWFQMISFNFFFRIQTSTSSSGNMGCWSCCGFTCCGFNNMNTIVLRTPAGILKIFEFVSEFFNKFEYWWTNSESS